MHLSEPYLPRRALLSGAISGWGLLVLSGCTSDDAPPAPTAPDPLEPVLATTVYLIDRYTAAIAAVPNLADRLAPLRDAHRAHAVALTRELGTVDSGVLPSGRPPAPIPASTSPGPALRSPSAGPSTSRSASRGATPPAPTASATPLPTERSAILADLRETERLAQRQAMAVCLAGSRFRAPLVGSIAAARASHAEVLA